MTTENVAILFTDIVGSTELSQGLSPDAADEVGRGHFSILRQAIAEKASTEVKGCPIPSGRSRCSGSLPKGSIPVSPSRSLPPWACVRLSVWSAVPMPIGASEPFTLGTMST